MEAFLIAIAIVPFLGWATIQRALAEEIDQDSVVFIQCVGPGGSINKGSGVIINNAGRILTVKHIAPPGYECKGSRGTAASDANRKLTPRKVSPDFDAMTFDLVPNPKEKFVPVKFRAPKGIDVGLTAFGFSGSTGEFARREGHLSAKIPDATGNFSTDILVTREMEGGPVMLSQGRFAIGIVSGNNSYDDKTGSPTSYGVLSADVIASELDFTLAPQDEGQIVYFSKPADGNSVVDALSDSGIQFQTQAGQNNKATNMIVCSPDFPIELLQEVAITLIDHGIKIYDIRKLLPFGKKRINIESEDAAGFTPMTRDDVFAYKQCVSRSPTLPPHQISFLNQCDVEMTVNAYRFDEEASRWVTVALDPMPSGVRTSLTHNDRPILTWHSIWFFAYNFDPEDGTTIEIPRQTGGGPTYPVPGVGRRKFQQSDSGSIVLTCN